MAALSPSPSSPSTCPHRLQLWFQVQHKLVSIDGNASHSENCFKFIILYAAVFVNQYGPESNGAMSCIFGRLGGRSLMMMQFSTKNFIGRDGFGLVFKGVLSDGSVVAVKRILESDFQRDMEFCNEVEIISNLKHRNLVPLRGCCVVDDDDDEKFNDRGSQSFWFMITCRMETLKTICFW
ncbi:hypothetical protein Ahy_B09g095879 isoform A [Arachis hypogaea]|uniref:Protein kinase domain-containing protein n=1 Tax=Arachis hypogaea TaxID=3818 RepID=A0A444XH18_ARAHY|nr:hypothetical protein Ahy_B09g095879 isoform A [Arachis hypogaea]